MSQKNDSEPLDVLELFQKRPTVIKPGLERIKAALSILGSPGLNTPRIVVAGTNGKGSTSGFVWRLLAASGLRAGLFSSPHLVEFRERITVTDRDVSNELIVRHVQRLKSLLPPSLWSALSFFEINTILALTIFDELETDVNVLEIGLGGRLDCCNVYDPDISVITSIGLDHQEFLGSTLRDVAREKAGIMRRGVPVIWGGIHSSESEADDTIRECAVQIGAELFPKDEEFEMVLPESIRDRPEFLRRNFSIACMGLREFAKSGKMNGFSRTSLDSAIKNFDMPNLPWPVTLTGRFDLIRVSQGSRSQLLLIDVCHNPHGAKALARALDESKIISNGQRLPCLISVLADKDVSGIWEEIRGKINDVIKFRIPSARSWVANDPRLTGGMMESFDEAWVEANTRQNWLSSDPWLIFGSVAAVGEVFAYFKRSGWVVERLTNKI